MGKKKFIDKKKSAKLLLFARDSSDPSYDDSPRNGRVFVRVDNNSYSIDSFFAASDNADTDDPNLIFADALEDCDIDEDNSRVYASLSSVSHHPLPEHVRKKILELGFPDDGYNYLLHLREIKNIGGNSAFYSNPKTRLDQLPSDVKAYDASRLRISEVSDECNEQYMYNVASETVSVSVKRAVDPEVATLLNDSNLSQFGSDVEDLEEDFVIRANFSKDNEGVSNDKGLSLLEQSEFKDLIAEENDGFGQPQFVDLSSQGGDGNHVMEVKNEFEKP